MSLTSTTPSQRQTHRAHGWAAGVGIAALAALLYTVATLVYRLITGPATAQIGSRSISVLLLEVAIAWIAASPATAAVAALLSTSPRRTRVLGYTLAAGTSLALLPLLFLSMAPQPLSTWLLTTVALGAVVAFGSAFVAAMVLTRPHSATR